MFEYTESLFRECLQEALVESLPEGSTEQDRQALINELATRWNFNPEIISHE